MIRVHNIMLYITQRPWNVQSHSHTHTNCQNSPSLVCADKPLCRPDQKKVYGVARNEAAHILCEVDAFPPPVTFKWSFNNTAETLDMPQSGFEKHSPRASKLTYIPVKVSRLERIALASACIFILCAKDNCARHKMRYGTMPDKIIIRVLLGIDDFEGDSPFIQIFQLVDTVFIHMPKY